MGFLDKAKDLAGKNADKVDSAIDKAGDLFDEKTGGKHAQHTDKVQDKVGDYLTGDRAQNPEPGA
ncbi:antitoxin [Dietzia alimentaria]|uniref:antitoxin n=1 Tax=Dietzia alimentaria TaxID=665550 RepID=UPI00029A7670|nr:antitoxin [Dietzia alimentaria]